MTVRTEPFIALTVQLAAPLDLGATAIGHRRCTRILGGRFSGQLSGAVLTGGADWQTVRGDGAVEIAAHYLLETDAAALIELRSSGVRVPHESGAPYFWTGILLSSSAPVLHHLANSLFLATGVRQADAVVLDVLRIL